MRIPSSRLVRRRRAFVGIFALLLTCGLAWPLMTPWFYDQHEGFAYATRLLALAEGWSTQHAHPRWSPELAAGHGYPLLNFYPPGFSYLALPFLPLGSVTAVKLTVLVSTYVGILLLYGLGRHVGGFAGGLAAATLGATAPYTLCNLHTRGDFAEYVAFFAAAGVTWALLHALRSRMRTGPALLFAVALGAFVPLHTISSLVYTAIWVLVAGVLGARYRLAPSRWLRLAGGFALGLALSAWYWLPALLEKQYVSTERMLDQKYVIEDHFAELPRYFLGVSRSYQILGPVITTGFLFILFAAWKLPRRRTRLALCGLVVLGCILLNFDFSAPFWKHMPLVRYMQFPWRLNGPAILFTGLGVAAALRVFKPAVLRRFVAPGAVAFLLITIAGLGLSLNKIIWIEPDAQALSGSADHWLTASARDEYLPRGVVTDDVPLGSPLMSPENVVESASISGAEIEGVVKTDTARRVVIRQFAYPGWSVYVDGEAVEWQRDNIGRLVVEVPSGTHVIRAEMSRTGVQIFAEWLSALAVLLAGLGSVWLVRQRKANAS